jgi:hypothetical protein
MKAALRRSSHLRRNHWSQSPALCPCRCAFAEPASGPASPTLSDEAQLAQAPAKRAIRQGGKPASPANPFYTTDDRANCAPCGYLDGLARERRGLMTCAECVEPHELLAY